VKLLESRFKMICSTVSIWYLIISNVKTKQKWQTDERRDEAERAGESGEKRTLPNISLIYHIESEVCISRPATVPGNLLTKVREWFDSESSTIAGRTIGSMRNLSTSLHLPFPVAEQRASQLSFRPPCSPTLSSKFWAFSNRFQSICFF